MSESAPKTRPTPARADAGGSSPYYVTTPIFYVNDAPHIGHAYAAIVADVLARYHRLFGEETFFLTGTDEHGQKVERAATDRKTTPQAHADEYVKRFQEAWPKLHIAPDRFIRTTEARHKANVQAALQKVYDAGLIYSDEYKGYYHVADETFVTPDNVNPADVESGDVVELAEKNYFFKMSAYQQWLIDYVGENPDFILPKERRNWVLGHLREPLGDLCISRPKERLSWGIELPFDSGFVCYVWFDALLNYLSGIDWDFSKSSDEQAPGVLERWENCTHVIGKDILQHHGIYWPIMLKALDLPLPRHIFATGWWIGESGDKISKRQGGSLAWLWLGEKYGADALRYFLMREMVLGQDSAISEELFLTRYNAELANGLGNLLSRCVKIAERSCEGKVPAIGATHPESEGLLAAGKALRDNVKADVIRFAPHAALDKIAAFVRDTNAYFDAQAPWNLAKDSALHETLGTVLRTTMEAVATAAALLAPVMPEKASEAFTALGLPTGIDDLRLQRIDPGSLLSDGAALNLRDSLFQRIDSKKIEPGPPEDAAPAAKKGSDQPAKAGDQDSAGLITIDDFGKVQLRTAEILAAEPVEGSDRLLKLQVAVGAEKRQLVAGIAKYYDPAALVGKRVVIVANLQPATIFGIESQGMVLAAKKGKKLTLLTTDGDGFASGASVS